MKLHRKTKVDCPGIIDPPGCRNSECYHHGSHSTNTNCIANSCTYHGVVTVFKCIEVEKERVLTFTERYREKRKEDIIFGTLWHIYDTFTEFYSQSLALLAKEGFGFPVGLIYDGYWLVFLSPFVLAYWILLIPMIAVFSLLWLVLWVLFIPIGIWTLAFEFPASILNKKEVEYWK